jgi:hypothetical protein
MNAWSERKSDFASYRPNILGDYPSLPLVLAVGACFHRHSGDSAPR